MAHKDKYQEKLVAIDTKIASCTDLESLAHEIFALKQVKLATYFLDRTYPNVRPYIEDLMCKHSYGERMKICLWRRYPNEVEELLMDSFLLMFDWSGGVNNNYKQIYNTSTCIVTKINLDRYYESPFPNDLKFYICHSKDFVKVLDAMKRYGADKISYERDFVHRNFRKNDHEWLIKYNQEIYDLIENAFDTGQYDLLINIMSINMGDRISDLCKRKVFEYDLDFLINMGVHGSVILYYKSIVINCYFDKKWSILNMIWSNYPKYIYPHLKTLPEDTLTKLIADFKDHGLHTEIFSSDGQDLLR
jgi:hypothetical protein